MPQSHEHFTTNAPHETQPPVESLVRLQENLSKGQINFQPIDTPDMSTGIAMNASDDPRNAAYVQYINKGVASATKDGKPGSAAKWLDRMYNSVRGKDLETDSPLDYPRPATYVVLEKGIAWSAGNHPDGEALLLIRADGTIEHLGQDDTQQYGVIKDVKEGDSLHILPNSLVATYKDTDLFDQSTIEYAESVPNLTDSVSVTLTATPTPHARSATATPESIAGAEARRNARRLNEATTQFAPTAPARTGATALTAPEEPTETGHDEQPAAATAMPANGDLMTQLDARAFTSLYSEPIGPENEPASTKTDTDSPTLPIEGATPATYRDDQAFGPNVTPAMINKNAHNLEKYTEKVTEYEALATQSLGKRLKGRLFKPLTRSGKERAAAQEQAIYLMDKYTLVLDLHRMQQLKLEGQTDEQAAATLREEQQQRLQARAHRQHEELSKGRMASMMEKYSNLPTKKKVVYGLAAAAALASGAAVLGTAGGATAIVGGIGIAGAKAGKTYFQQHSKLYRAERDEVLPEFVSTKSADGTAMHAAWDQAFATKNYTQSEREKSLKQADKTKRIAVGVTALSAAAIGIGVATKIAEHHDDITNGLNYLRHNVFGHGTAAPTDETPLPGNNVAPTHDVDQYTPPTPAHEAVAPKDLGGATELSHSGLDHFNEWANGHTVQPGESVWQLSRDYLQANGVSHPSQFQIDAVKDKVLAEFSAKGLVDSNGWLMAGEQLNIQ